MHYIFKYFPNIDDGKIEKFSMLAELYPYWNEKINLISRKDIDNLYQHHVLHSLALCYFEKFSDSVQVLDVGTGGGFPGIPLAIMFPETSFVLYDGRSKKIKAVNDIVSKLEIKNVEAQSVRIEDIDKQFNVIIGRAVTSVDVFLTLVSKNLKKNGIVYYWTGQPMKVKGWSNTIFKIDEAYEEEFYKNKFIEKFIRKINKMM